MEDPRSPDDIIDPRWNKYLHAENAGPGAATARDREAGSPGELGQQMRDIIELWQQGLRGTRETLEALRELANRSL